MEPDFIFFVPPLQKKILKEQPWIFSELLHNRWKTVQSNCILPVLTGTGAMELSKSRTGSVISEAILSAICSMSSPRSPLLSVFVVAAEGVPGGEGTAVGDLHFVVSSEVKQNISVENEFFPVTLCCTALTSFEQVHVFTFTQMD